MARKKSKTAETLFEVMLHTVEDDLIANAEILGFNQHGEMEGMKTYEMRKYLAKQVLANPKQVLDHLSNEDLVLFQQLVDAGPGMSAVYISNGSLPPCVTLDLINCQHDLDEGKVFYTMTDDLREAVSPYIHTVYDEFETRFRLHIENLVLGVLNIYGCLTERQLKSLLKEHIGLEDDGTGVLEHIYPQSAAIQLCCLGFDEDFGEPLYVSPFVVSVDEILASRKEHPEIKDLKHFDKELVKEAGMMPTPDIPNPMSAEIEHLLKTKAGFTEQEAILMEFSIWLLIQQEENVSDVIQELLESDDRLESVLPQLSDYMNHCPRWEFCGYCPDDLFRMGGGLSGKPHISMGPNGGEDAMSYANPFKVGRNDPCPCGSGKKYKDCCGRAN